MDKKTILYIDEPIYPIGGGQISLAIILDNLNHHKYEPVLFRIGDNSKNTYFSIIKNLYKILKKSKINLVHCNAGTSRVSFISALLCKIWNIPFIWHVRVEETSKMREIIIGLLSTKIIVISEIVRNKFKNPMNRKKTVKVYNAVNTEKFKAGLEVDYLYSEIGINKNKNIVGIFSRIIPLKGYELFLETVKKIEESIKDVCYIVVGDGEPDYKNKIIEYKKELNIEDDVLFLGFRKDIPELMNLCDLILHTSVEPEGFGRTIIESMACGVPVVATNLGGPLEIIENNISGIIVDPDPVSMSNEVTRLLRDSDLRNKISKESVKAVFEKFSVPIHMKEIESIYDSIR